MEVKRPNPKIKSRVLDVMRFFAYMNQGHNSQRRITKLAYLSELMFLDKHYEPLTGARFISYDYGVFSLDIATAYDEIEAECEDMKVVPRATTHGDARSIQPTQEKTIVHLDPERYCVISKTFDFLGYVRTDLIVRMSKRSSLFQKTKYADPIDLVGYAQRREAAFRDLKGAPVGTKIELPSLGYLWKVRVEDKGYSAECEDLSGCITQGDTFEELEENMRQAILGYLDCEAELRENAS